MAVVSSCILTSSPFAGNAAPNLLLARDIDCGAKPPKTAAAAVHLSTTAYN